ncbi:Lnb N-terminal periplasmic domain-containing protein [Paracoccus aminophilus]|uniref:Lnb N-terminal periplasmic domain-containing protein n=1 Tax=Paracoccus aminophilus JCM 7686 TaxID=1367847 RepID=S5YPL1_PARAH|nr:DUF4105 domain-containing protein [Paracoccus aminophilus]AGT07251.1 hypothetical protein JCM7686_0140 [Paracoccus aminophilus JCM 7686]
MLLVLNRLALILATALFALFTFGALTYQTEPPWRVLFYAALALTVLAVWRAGRKWGWLVLTAGLVVVAGWYAQIRPSNDRIWESDVSRGVTAVTHGNFVTLQNVRDFDWQTRDQGTERWRDMTFDLREITEVDLFNSIWSSPLIAHTLISFGFSDGRRIVFSAEIRREKGEVFSTFGGFFRKFELVIIAATEEDIVRLRTTARREDVSLFPLRVTPDQARELFLAYITRANALKDHPEFYNTLTSNCTTIIWELAHAIDHRLPFDWRVLVSGMLPEYLKSRGLLYSDQDIATIREEARISALAQAQDLRGSAYSQLIRSGSVRELMPKP